MCSALPLPTSVPAQCLLCMVFQGRDVEAVMAEVRGIIEKDVAGEVAGDPAAAKKSS